MTMTSAPRDACRLLFGVLLLVSVSLSAQPTLPERARTWPVDSVLVHFDRDTRAHVVNSTAGYVMYGILDLPDTFRARRDSLLDGLERLSLSSDDERVRHYAASRLAAAGTVGRETPPTRGAVTRLLRLYRNTADRRVRSAIRDYLPEQAERRAAVALLRVMAAEPDPHAHLRMDPIGDERVEALHGLSLMGEEGRAALQAMHRSGEARSPHARGMLADMARRGFPVRDLARERRTQP